VYARLSLANRDMEPEIECFDAATGKAEGFGELKGGLLLTVSLELCRQYVSDVTRIESCLARLIARGTG
jgi:exosome complex component RRP40